MILRFHRDVLWILIDKLRSICDLAEYDAGADTTTVVNHITYDAFGNVTSETHASVDHLFGYTGRAFDASTGLQNNLNRWYDATTGRWMSEDPIGFNAGDPNLYRYVGNFATGAVDPDGLEETVWNSKEVREVLDDLDPNAGAFWKSRPITSADPIGQIEGVEHGYIFSASFEVGSLEYGNFGNERKLTKILVRAPVDMNSAQVAMEILNQMLGADNSVSGRFEMYLMGTEGLTAEGARLRRERILEGFGGYGQVLRDLAELVPTGGADAAIGLDHLGNGDYLAGGFSLLMAFFPVDEACSAIKVTYKAAKGTQVGIRITSQAYAVIKKLPKAERRAFFKSLREAEDSKAAQKLISKVCAGARRHKFSGKTGKEILGGKKGSIKSAGLPSGSPSWSEIEGMTWEAIDKAAREGKTGFRTIKKLLTDQRFDR